MIRIDVVYGGHPYTVAVDDPEALKAQVLDAVSGGTPFWLTVNEGAGTLKPTDVLISPGVAVSLSVIDVG